MSQTLKSEILPNESFIDSLGVSNFDLCVVAIGDDFQSSLETTALLKDYGSKLVVARAVRDVHAKFLLRNGADEVVYPEKQIGNWAAVRFSSENIFDYVQLTPEYSIYEIDRTNRLDWKNHVRTRYS